MHHLIDALRALPQDTHHVRIDVDGGRGRLTVSMPEGQLSAAFDAGDIKACTFAVDGKVSRLARALPQDAVARYRGNKLRLECSSGTYTFSALAADVVSVVAEPEQWETKHVSPAWLRKALQYVRTAASTNDIRLFLQGVYLCLGERNEVVASNGTVAAIVAAPGQDGAQAAKIILPNKCVAEIIRLLDAGEEPATIEFGMGAHGGAMLRVQANGLTYVALGFDAQYPDHERVFSGNQACSAVRFDNEALAQAVSRLTLTVQAKTPTLRLSVGQGQLKLSSTENPDKDGVETLSVTDDPSTSFEFGVNAHQIAAAIEAAGTFNERTDIGFAAPDKALTICPASEAPSTEEHKWIVAPFKI